MRAGTSRALSALVIALSLFAALPPSASARSSSVVSYHYEQVWGAAVRLIRVDQGFAISDQDRDVGYILFDYTRSGHRAQGSLELIRSERSDRPEIRVIVHLSNTPSYLERLLLDQLERKLRGDFGDPAPVRPSSPPRSDDKEEKTPNDSDPSVDEKQN